MSPVINNGLEEDLHRYYISVISYCYRYNGQRKLATKALKDLHWRAAHGLFAPAHMVRVSQFLHWSHFRSLTHLYFDIFCFLVTKSSLYNLYTLSVSIKSQSVYHTLKTFSKHLKVCQKYSALYIVFSSLFWVVWEYGKTSAFVFVLIAFYTCKWTYFCAQFFSNIRMFTCSISMFSWPLLLSIHWMKQAAYLEMVPLVWRCTCQIHRVTSSSTVRLCPRSAALYRKHQVYIAQMGIPMSLVWKLLVVTRVIMLMKSTLILLMH